MDIKMGQITFSQPEVARVEAKYCKSKELMFVGESPEAEVWPVRQNGLWGLLLHLPGREQQQDSLQTEVSAIPPEDITEGCVKVFRLAWPEVFLQNSWL